MASADRNARRRLERILADVELGPALARLPKDQSDAVLRLIDRNQMDRARTAIRRFDARRRINAREKARETRQSASGERQAIPEVYDVVSHALDVLGDVDTLEPVSVVTLHNNAQSMDSRTRRSAMRTDGEEWKIRASYQPSEGEARNPFWYH